MTGAGKPVADGGALEGAAGSLQSEPAARLADVCARRGAVYQALALGFREPTAAYLEALLCGELVEGLREAVAWLGDDASLYEPALVALSQVVPAAAELGSAAALRTLAVEYARLFTGPGRPAVMCYASQYLEAGQSRPARLNGAAAAYAAAAYQAAGVAPVDSPRELPDHVAIELEFLFHLCRREEEAWAAWRERRGPAPAPRARRVPARARRSLSDRIRRGGARGFVGRVLPRLGRPAHRSPRRRARHRPRAGPRRLRRVASTSMDQLRLLDAGLRAFDASLPDVVPPLCVVTRYRASSCRRCLDVCPSAAIQVSPWLQVEPDRCSSCGACAAVCPTGALDFATRAAALRERLAAVAGSGDRHITLVCRFVGGDALGEGDGRAVVVVSCLGGLSAADLIGAAAAGVAGVTLLRADCESCSDHFAGANVAATVELVGETVTALGCDFTISWREMPGDLAAPGPTSGRLSRRDLFSFVGRGVRRAAAEGLRSEKRTVADLHAQAEPPVSHRHLLSDLDRLGQGHKQRSTALPAALPLGTLAASERCDGCGLCTRYCPHRALVLCDGGLLFDRSLCSGCGLCVEICPLTALAVGPQTIPVEWSLAGRSSSSVTRLRPTT